MLLHLTGCFCIKVDINTDMHFLYSSRYDGLSTVYVLSYLTRISNFFPVDPLKFDQ